MFLSGIEAKERRLKQKFDEIRTIIAEARLPGSGDYGLSCALKLPPHVHDRLEEVRSRHGLRSLREAAFKALTLGLATMERLPPEGSVAPRREVVGRALTESEISRLKDEGFDCPRVPPPPQYYADDEELAAVG